MTEVSIYRSRMAMQRAGDLPKTNPTSEEPKREFCQLKCTNTPPPGFSGGRFEQHDCFTRVTGRPFMRAYRR